MSKILYPVGTKVVLTQYAKRDHSTLTPLYVVQYNKGEKFPYRLSRTQSGPPAEFKGMSKFSVRGLKRYNPALTAKQEPSFEEAMERAEQEAPACDCISREEVQAMINSVVVDIYTELGMSIEGVRADLYRVADVSDKNFCRVSKAFKTLNHDDD